MKSAQFKEVTTLVAANVEGTISNPNWVIYGTDMLTPEQAAMFDGLFDMEIERLVRIGTIKLK